MPAAAEQDQALGQARRSRQEAGRGSKERQRHPRQDHDARRTSSKTLAEAAGKAQDAVKKLPKEKDLADAAQKFVDRSKKTATDLAALQKTSAANSAALKKASEDVALAVKPVETARAKALPLREAVREKESVVLATRKKMAECRIALEHHKKRVRLLEAYAQRIDLDAQAAAAAKSVSEKREAVVQARSSRPNMHWSSPRVRRP